MMDETALQQRFLLEIEQRIRVANREVIHKRIPPITSENLLPFVVSVARLRARPAYVRATEIDDALMPKG